MIKWGKFIFGKLEAANSSTDTVQDSDLLKQFEVFLADRMIKFYPDVRDAFATLLDADFSEGVNRHAKLTHLGG